MGVCVYLVLFQVRYVYSVGDHGEFFCTATMPSFSPVEKRTGQGATSKQRAKASSALEVCRALLEAGCLDADNLTPVRPISSTDRTDLKLSDDSEDMNGGSGGGTNLRPEKGIQMIDVVTKPPRCIQWDSDAYDDHETIVANHWLVKLYRIDDFVEETEREEIEKWGMSKYGIVTMKKLPEEDLYGVEVRRNEKEK